jgi:hypothetical protein
MVSYPIQVWIWGYIIFFKNIRGIQLILDIGYDTGMSIRYDTGINT